MNEKFLLWRERELDYFQSINQRTHHIAFGGAVLIAIFSSFWLGMALVFAFFNVWLKEIFHLFGFL